MKGVKLPIYVYTDEQVQLNELGVEFEEETVLENRMFWNIDHAYVNRENEDETVFWVSGDSFITPIKFKEFCRLVNENI